jgi:hypothetical protein
VAGRNKTQNFLRFFLIDNGETARHKNTEGNTHKKREQTAHSPQVPCNTSVLQCQLGPARGARPKRGIKALLPGSSHIHGEHIGIMSCYIYGIAPTNWHLSGYKRKHQEAPLDLINPAPFLAALLRIGLGLGICGGALLGGGLGATTEKSAHPKTYEIR